MQGNVKEPQFDVDFFKSFDLVMNGLDNLEARRHVNRLCLAAETPLIESGTAGYLGQVRGALALALVLALPGQSSSEMTVPQVPTPFPAKITSVTGP